ncbi:MAG: zinc ribbon-containing protein, partial [Aeromonas sp.]
MDKRQKGYEAFIAELHKQWQEAEQHQGVHINKLIAKVQAYLEAASDLTQDELAL